MIQTLALLLDAYRDLNARKLFWVTLALSGALVLTLAMIGADHDAITFFFKWRWEVPDPSFVYRQLVLILVAVGIWLSWGAVILALVSTAGIFPDLIAGGAIDLYLSKPISRLRLFLTKYATGLLFVTLQLAIFCAGLFVVVGLRLHEWRASLFLPILLVTLLFSYVYSFSVLLGIWTRSTVAALLLAILIWMCLGGIERGDNDLLILRRALEVASQRTTGDIAYIDSHPAPADAFHFQAGLLRKRREADEARLADFRADLRPIAIIENIASAFQLALPKTKQTDDLLDRFLLSDDEIEVEQPGPVNGGALPFGLSAYDLQTAAAQVQKSLRHRSWLYVIGTSLACEVIVVGAAAWIFCRRDY